MPLTPAHIGPAVLIGGLAGRKLNLTVLITSTILIDLEVLVLGLKRGMFIHHGLLHTLSGAAIFGLVYGTIFFVTFQLYWKGKDVYYADNKIYRKLKELRNHDWMNSYKCVVASAIIGAYSHIALDWLLYEDIWIIAISSANIYDNFTGNFFSATYLSVYLFCAINFILGIFLYFYRFMNNKNKLYKTPNLYDISLHKKDYWALMGIISTPFAISGFVIYLIAIYALTFNPDNILNPLNVMVQDSFVLIFSSFPILTMIIGYSRALENANWKLIE